FPFGHFGSFAVTNGVSGFIYLDPPAHAPGGFPDKKAAVILSGKRGRLDQECSDLDFPKISILSPLPLCACSHCRLPPSNRSSCSRGLPGSQRGYFPLRRGPYCRRYQRKMLSLCRG